MLETRHFGRTGHMSTVAIFGGAAFWEISQKEADRVMEMVIASGVNHIDVAPSYGQAEQRIGPWMRRERGRFFLGCKTMERTRKGAWAELRKSLKRLQSESFDLYQLHAVTSLEELDAVSRPGGALEALVEARQAGLIRHIGITGHGVNAPAIYLEALRRFDFDSVLFPLNFVQAGNADYYRDSEELIRQCRLKDVGLMVIKSIAQGPWGEKEKTHTTWYEPFPGLNQIQLAVNFVLSHDVTGICTAGDIRLLPLVLQACENFAPMPLEQRHQAIEFGRSYQPLFV
jgi:aryl-alcohol dehydrogenase-like predicted oxidoreductase